MTTHAVVETVNPDEFESVEQGLQTVESTLRACKAAQLHQEIDQLDKVLRKLKSNFDYLRTHGKPKKLTPDELARLVAEGDPNCPKGQAYKPKAAAEQIRCTGPKLSDVNWSQAKTFYENRGFKLTTQGNELKAEYGSESYTYEFRSENDPTPAKCIRVFVAPGISWQESVARLTGEAPHRLQEGKPVRTSRGKLSLSHIQDDVQAIYNLGECD